MSNLDEALAYYDQLHATQGEQADQLQVVVVEAARRWAEFPTDEDVEAAAKAIQFSLDPYVDKDKPADHWHKEARAALEAVKREEP